MLVNAAFIGIKKPLEKSGVVPRTGIEPALPCDNQILSLARLPIPPSRQIMVCNISSTSEIDQK